MGDKLVMHCRGLSETTVRYDKYVVNGKLFHTLVFDVGKRTQNNGVCVPTIDGNPYFGKLMEVIKVEYFDKTKYVMFKCDWTDSTRDRGTR
jgi:hypothetical protein